MFLKYDNMKNETEYILVSLNFRGHLKTNAEIYSSSKTEIVIQVSPYLHLCSFCIGKFILLFLALYLLVLKILK